jgi:Xaa-Pro aminopeptidase
MHKHPYGAGASDFQEGINFARMRRERLARAQAALKRHGIAAALLMRADNMRYTTSMRGHEFAPQLSYVLLFAEHEPIVYELGDQLGQQERYCPWIEKENWRYSYSWLGSIGGADAARDESRLFAQALVRDLKERGVYGEKLGFDNLDEVGRRALAEAGVELTGVMPAMMEARSPKTADEIACIRTAISIANSGFASLSSFRPGLRERDAAAAAFDAMLRAGAEAVAGGLRTGPNTFDVYHVNYTDRIVDPGDLGFMLTCGTSYAGYRVCIYRSVIVGRRPNAKEQDWYRRCHERVYAIIEAIKPGATTADAARPFLPASTWGYEAEQPLLVAEVGHGIGMGYEPPVISRLWSFDHPQVFEPGMVIAVECREGEPGYGGVRLEEMVLVTETGHEVLTNWPSDEIMPVGLALGG